MGNCFAKPKKSKVEIAPYDFGNRLPPVRLYCSPSGNLATYIRFALLHKNLTLHFVPTDTAPFAFETPVLQIGTETVSGYRETLLGFIESKFPNPPLAVCSEDTTPLVARVTWLQHRSMMWHFERLVRWAEDLATRGGRRAVDPAVGSPRMEVKKFGKSYSQLLEVMLEHAQMEERVVFPVLEMADRGLCKAANEEHARDLPLMNGIREDIKSIAVLDMGSPAYHEALTNLSSRLKSLQKHSKQHFDEEERDLLPLLEAAELSQEQQKRVLQQCYDVMKTTHTHFFEFFLEGLLPLEAMQYLDLIMKYSDED